jgi:CDP-diacylglycerol--glycerol-3-phosphate 3-phosphatidyltransferase
VINLPNILSMTRILLVPLLMVVLLTKFEGREIIGLDNEFIALIVFLVAALTDFLDGFIARRRKQVTRLGQLLDPAADKILTSSAFIALVELGLMPAWMVVVIVGREFAVSALRSIAAIQGIAISAVMAGKVKTTLQIITIAVLIVSTPLPVLQNFAPALRWLTVTITLYSGVEYFFRFGRLVVRGNV